MSEAKFRIKFKSRWNGPKAVGEEARQYNVDDIEDVDTDTFRALVFTYGIAEAVSVDEIIKEAKEEKPKEPTGKRASRTKATAAKRNKMVTDAANKGE